MEEDYDLPEFDTIRIKTFIEENTNVNIVTYLVTIVLYIISFTYLFRKDSTEYITWILLFILNFVTPLLWVTDMMKLFQVVSAKLPEFNKNVFMYGFFSLVISFLLTFIGLFMVLLKNEDIRKVKKEQGHYKNSTEMPNLNTNIKEVEKKDRKISIMYTKIVTLMWGMVAFNFGEYLTNSPAEKKYFTFGSKIKTLMSVVPDILSWLDSTIHYYFKGISLPALVKSSFVYVVTFILVFFGIFAKVKYFPDATTVGLREEIEIVNMTQMFPRQFDIEFTEIRHFVIFLLSFLSTIMFGESMNLMNGVEFLPNFPTKLIYFLTAVFSVIIFPILFSKQDEWFPKDRIKDIAFFFVCVIFGLVGAAPVTASIELVFSLLRNSGLPLFLGTNALTIYSVCVVLLSSVMFMIGMLEDWIDTDGKSMKTFLALLVTMTVSLFTALSTEYTVFKNLYDMIAFILRFVMKFLAPIVMVILSFIVVFYSHKNHKIIKNRANDDIVAEKEAEDTPNKTADPIKDQRKVRKMLKNTMSDFTSYLDVKGKAKMVKSMFGF